MVSPNDRDRESPSSVQAIQDTSLVAAPLPSLFSPTKASRLGRFELRRELGRGGVGIVFLAWDSQLRREVAVKIPRWEELATPELRLRFLREARAAAALDHPGIVPVYEVDEVEDICFLVSAFCSGGNLAQWLEQQTAPVSPRLAAVLIAEVAEAVQYIHANHICHRDIKPSNILLQPRSQPAAGDLPFAPRLADFGLAKFVEGRTKLTHSGAILGTPVYMAPEQASGQPEKVGPHADIYALGVVLYELLTGKPPFHGSAPLDILRRTLDEPPSPPRRICADLPRALEIICLKCLEKEPSLRYASAAELAADLRRFLNGEPIQARPPTQREQVRRWCGRPERIRSAGMFLVLFGLLFFLWCVGGLMGVPLGFLQPPRPLVLVRYVLIHVALFYVPMMAAGWKVLAGSRRALWIGTLAALALFLRVFVLGVIWSDYLGNPQPSFFDMGGLFEQADKTHERILTNLLISSMAGLLCLYCGVALHACYPPRSGRGRDNTTVADRPTDSA